MADEPEKFDPFKPAPPRIPGVTDAPRPEPEAETPAEALPPARPAKFSPPVMAAAAAGAVVLLIVVGWMLLRPSPPVEPAATAASDTSGAPGASATPAATTPSSPNTTTAPEVTPMYPDEVASIEELAKPWAAKRFNFLKKFGSGPVPSLIVRLPGGNPKNPDAYWAFALKLPYGKCDLVLLTDLDKIRNEHSYRAQHPMVVDPCTNTVYDPLQRGTVGNAWVRGAVVQGTGLRPPLMIQVEIKGNRILAALME